MHISQKTIFTQHGFSLFYRCGESTVFVCVFDIIGYVYLKSALNSKDSELIHNYLSDRFDRERWLNKIFILTIHQGV